MGYYEELKKAIAEVIRENGKGEITGELLQQTLISIVNIMGDGARFGGVAKFDTKPAKDRNIFYIINRNGRYEHFNLNVEDVKTVLIVTMDDGGIWETRSSGAFIPRIVTDNNDGLMSKEMLVEMVDIITYINEELREYAPHNVKILLGQEREGSTDYIVQDIIGLPDITTEYGREMLLRCTFRAIIDYGYHKEIITLGMIDSGNDTLWLNGIYFQAGYSPKQIKIEGRIGGSVEIITL